MAPAEVRAEIRAGRYASHTAGLGAGHLQTNLAILPASFALDFMRYCQRNPKPCPLVGVSDTGDPMMRTLGRDIDIRSDVPRYSLDRPKKAINTIAGAVLGLLLGGVIVFVLEYLESSIVRRRDDLERMLEMPVLATIPDVD